MYNDEGFDALNNCLINTDWNFIFENEDPNQFYDEFWKIINEKLNEFFPVITVNKTKNNVPMNSVMTAMV